MKISNDCGENYETMEHLISLNNLDGMDVLNLLTDWHGTQLLSYEFMENLRDCEGYDELEGDEDE